jgi:hypothetical protein
VANISMTEAAYWTVPERLAPLARSDEEMGRTTFWNLGPDDPSTPLIALLDMPPGRVIARHAHQCERFEMVVRGSLDVGDRMLHPGDVMTAAPGEFYGPKVAGPEGCTTVEVFSKQVGVAGEILYELTDGSQVGVDHLAGERPPAELAGMEGVAERVAAVLAKAAAVQPPRA